MPVHQRRRGVGPRRGGRNRGRAISRLALVPLYGACRSCRRKGREAGWPAAVPPLRRRRGGGPNGRRSCGRGQGGPLRRHGAARGRDPRKVVAVSLPAMSLGSSAPTAQQHSRLTTALLYGGAAVGVIALHLATNSTLGFHTDELYYLTCGLHPALGYVDFPPLVPLLARVETGLLGVSPWTLRLLPSLLGGFLVALSGLYVRRLGGSLRLQGIALLSAIAAPFLLGSNWVFQTVTFDQVTWMVSLYWFLCLVTDRRPRYWIYLGVTLGIGLEVKYTIVGLIAGICVAVLITRSLRMELGTRYPWIAAGIALLIWAPNLAWQVMEGFPTLIYLTNHNGGTGGPVVYLIQFTVYFFFLLPVWLAGMISLF